MEKETSEREYSGADEGAVNGTVTVISRAEVGAHFSMSTKVVTGQSENKTII